MSTALLVVRLVLAGVFAVAGVSKLADLRGSRGAVAAFGVPARLAAPIGVLLPIAELIVAAALLPAGSARAGAIGAAVLLGLFVVAISRTMIRGDAPECHCFGQIHSAPVGRRTLARNAVLAGLAVFVVVAGWTDAGPSATGWVGRLSETATVAFAGVVVVAALAGGMAWVFVALLQQNGHLLLRVDALESRLDSFGVSAAAEPPAPYVGLALGSEAPAFHLSSLDGDTGALDALTARDRPALLLFAHPECSPCNALMSQVATWQHELGTRLTIAVISDGAGDDNRDKMREHGVDNVWFDEDRAVSAAYLIPGVPAAVLLDENHCIASGVAGGAEAITELVNRATSAHGS